MTPSELKCLFRTEMDDESKSVAGGVDDAQYSDPLLDHYVDEAERQAAENAMLIFDRTTVNICQIPVAADRTVYSIDGRILRIDRVDFVETDTAERQEVTIQTRESLDSDIPDWRDRNFSEMLACFVDETTIELTGSMDKTGTLYFELYRLPLRDASANGRFEIGMRNHSWLMHWVKYLAYNNKDADLYAPQLAEVHKREFERRFGYQKTADTWRYSQKNKSISSAYNGV